MSGYNRECFGSCVCVYASVNLVAGERDKERETERERRSEIVCVFVCVYACVH